MGWELPRGDYGYTPLFLICEVAAEFSQTPQSVYENWDPAWLQVGMDYCRLKRAEESRLEELRMSVGRR